MVVGGKQEPTTSGRHVTLVASQRGQDPPGHVLAEGHSGRGDTCKSQKAGRSCRFGKWEEQAQLEHVISREVAREEAGEGGTGGQTTGP